MSWAEVIALQGSGNEIASHTATHAHLGALPLANVTAEVVSVLNTFESNGVTRPETFVYPYGEGTNNRTVTDAIGDAGYHQIGDAGYHQAGSTTEASYDLSTGNRWSIGSFAIATPLEIPQMHISKKKLT